MEVLTRKKSTTMPEATPTVISATTANCHPRNFGCKLTAAYTEATNPAMLIVHTYGLNSVPWITDDPGRVSGFGEMMLSFYINFS